ncbi:MAG: hypothetical protein NVSMB26_21050 [Beijerinckiaceae bacterium]
MAYHSPMTELLEFVMRSASRLPAERQDYLARALMSLLEADASDDLEAIHPDDLAGVMRGLAQAERGELATNEEVEAAFRSFGE